jgi:hypothetical protein
VETFASKKDKAIYAKVEEWANEDVRPSNVSLPSPTKLRQYNAALLRVLTKNELEKLIIFLKTTENYENVKTFLINLNNRRFHTEEHSTTQGICSFVFRNHTMRNTTNHL